MIKIEKNQTYHSNNAISKSKLFQISKTPAYYKWYCDNPQEQTADLAFGSAFHKWVLEQDDFYNEFAVAPNFDKRTKLGKEQALSFATENNGKIIITEQDFEIIKDMYNSVMSNTFARKLLSKGKAEQSIYWTDELTGISCKCRPDYLRTIKHKKNYQYIINYNSYIKNKNNDIYDDKPYIGDKTKGIKNVSVLDENGKEIETFYTEQEAIDFINSTIEYEYIIIDLKSCRNADDYSVMKDSIKFGYDLQSGMYREGVAKEFDVDKEKVSFVFIFVEKTAPYLVNIKQADQQFMQRGENLMREYLGILKYCQETNNWYGYNGFSDELTELNLPSYLVNEKGE